jgi:hypothetical protein
MLHEDVAQVAEAGLPSAGFFIQARIGIGG